MPTDKDMLSVPLRHYLERMMLDHCAQNDIRFKSLEETTMADKRESSTRFAAANEWRAAMKDKDELYARNIDLIKTNERLHELEITLANHGALALTVSRLDSWSSNLMGRITVTVAIAMVGVSVLTAIVIKMFFK